MGDISNWLVAIPARIGSTRLPRKALVDLAGRPLIIRVYENLKPLQELGAEVVVATDSEEIIAACKQFGAKAAMTDAGHQSGTDRCAEVAKSTEHPYILNVQGDEPFVDTDDLVRLMQSFAANSSAAIGTLGYRDSDQVKFLDPNVVKIAVSHDNRALYFSRAAIPYERGQEAKNNFWQHLGIYAYRRQTLERFCSLAPSTLELTEGLEQLRALENRLDILVVEANTAAHGIDTNADLEVARARFN